MPKPVSQAEIDEFVAKGRKIIKYPSACVCKTDQIKRSVADATAIALYNEKKENQTETKSLIHADLNLYLSSHLHH